jgi:AraC-like DNA-binding protein
MYIFNNSHYLMKLEDTTNPSCHSDLNAVFTSASASHQLEIISRLRLHLLGLYHCQVGAEWGSCGRPESDYLHHIDIVLSGRRQVVFNGEVLDLEPGQAYWLPGNTPLERRCKEECRVIFLKLRCEWLPGMDPILDWPGRRPTLIGPCNLDYWQTWLRPRLQPTANHLLCLQAWLLESISKVIPDLQGLIVEHLRTHAAFAEVLALIERKLGADLKIEELAQKYGTSLHAFSMSFNRNTGMTPKAYLKRRLNQEAILLLTNTDFKIKGIADKLKFYDEYHFSRFFSQMNGAPPIRYRKSMRGIQLENAQYSWPNQGVGTGKDHHGHKQ